MDHARLLVPVSQNEGSFPHALSLKRSLWPPIFFACRTLVTHHLTAAEKLKKSIDWKIFARTSFRAGYGLPQQQKLTNQLRLITFDLIRELDKLRTNKLAIQFWMLRSPCTHIFVSCLGLSKLFFVSSKLWAIVQYQQLRKLRTVAGKFRSGTRLRNAQ